jgi:hypothetical protein
MQVSGYTIDVMKSNGFYFAAGALAFQLGRECRYGCHTGMRSSRDEAIAAFERGWHAAFAMLATFSLVSKGGLNRPLATMRLARI